MTGTTLIVVKGYPRLSETFIAQELLGLQQRGVKFQIASLRHPTDKKVHPINRDITAPVDYLPEYVYQEPMRVWRAWRRVRNLPGYRQARRVFFADWRRDPTPNRGRRWAQALVLAAELPSDTSQIYAHFLHTPSSVARYAAMIRDLPWSASAHAKDIWTSPDWELSEKLADCAWAVTCTRFGRDHLASLAPEEGRVDLLYHGLDFSRFPSPPDTASDNDGSQADQPVRILSVGRAVEKKGYDLLLQALADLPDGLSWHLDHIGGGKDLDNLKALAASLGIDARITWHGSQAQTAVVEAYRTSDLFVLASRVAKDGDRDGLPNVLMEAQGQSLACLSTEVPGVAELIDHGQTGWLVPPDRADALNTALEQLIADPDLRVRLAKAGCDKVRSEFSHDVSLDRLVEKLMSTEQHQKKAAE